LAIKDKADFVIGRTADYAQFDELAFEPSPMRLTPDDNIVMFVAPIFSHVQVADVHFQEFVHIWTGTLHRGKRSVKQRSGVDKGYCQPALGDTTHYSPSRVPKVSFQVEARSSPAVSLSLPQTQTQAYSDGMILDRLLDFTQIPWIPISLYSITLPCRLDSNDI
jgi:hypothetical protein